MAGRAEHLAGPFGGIEVLQVTCPTPRTRGTCWRQLREHQLLIIREVMSPTAPRDAALSLHSHVGNEEIGFDDALGWVLCIHFTPLNAVTPGFLEVAGPLSKGCGVGVSHGS